jgi:hypothetical protein
MRTGVVVRLLVAGLAGLVLWFSVTATVFAATSYSPGTYGNDISYPQCGSSSFPTNAPCACSAPPSVALEPRST